MWNRLVRRASRNSIPLIEDIIAVYVEKYFVMIALINGTYVRTMRRIESSGVEFVVGADRGVLMRQNGPRITNEVSINRQQQQQGYSWWYNSNSRNNNGSSSKRGNNQDSHMHLAC